jgi:hypothetical protein
MAIRLLNTTPQRVSWLLWAQPAETGDRDGPCVPRAEHWGPGSHVSSDGAGVVTG